MNTGNSFIKNPQDALDRLIAGNEIFRRSCTNPADISQAVREETAFNGQSPYAVVLTCSDSRVPPEHIFSAGIGDLFVVRTAGNVVGDFEIGSIEYGADELGASLIVVMGHSHCGAVGAALSGHAYGYIEDVVHEIQIGLDGAEDERTAIYNNIIHSKNRIMQSEIIRKLVRFGKIMIVCARYDINSGKAEFFKC